MKRQLLLKGILAFVAISSMVWFCLKMDYIMRNPTFTDYRIYFRGAEAAREGKPIYDIAGMQKQTFDPFYKYPPLEAHLLRFFVPYGLKTMAFSWFFMSIIFYVTSLFLWLHFNRIPLRSTEALLLFSMLFLSQPAVASLSGPQMDCFMLMLLVVCYWGTIRNWPFISGGTLAIVTMIKVFPAVLLIEFLKSRRWRFVGTFTVILFSLLFVSIWLAGIQQHKEFLFGVLPANSSGSAYVENQSMFGFLSRFVVDGSEWNSGRPVNLPTAMWISRLLGISMLIIMICISTTQNRMFLFPAIVVWLLIALPVVWIHYQTLLFFPYAVYLHYQLKQRQKDTAGWILLTISWICIAFGDQFLLFEAPVVMQSYKFYGVFILWLLYVKAMIQQRQVMNSESLAIQ